MLSLRRRGRVVARADAPARPDRPAREWAGLPPVRTLSAEQAAGVLAPADFRAALATTWSTPPALEELGHHVALDAPAGLIPARVAPVPAYDGVPLRFAPAVGSEQPPEPFDWSLPSRPAPPAPPAQETPAPAVAPSRPSLLDRVLRRTPGGAAEPGKTPAMPAPGEVAGGHAPSPELPELPADVDAAAPHPDVTAPAEVRPRVVVPRAVTPTPEVVRPERTGPDTGPANGPSARPLRRTPMTAGQSAPLQQAPAPPTAVEPLRRAVAPNPPPVEPAEKRSDVGPDSGTRTAPPLRVDVSGVVDVVADGAADRPAPVAEPDPPPPAPERSGSAEGPASRPVAGPPRFEDAEWEAEESEVDSAGTGESTPSVRPASQPLAVVPAADPAYRPAVDERAVIARRRPLGAELLDVVRAAGPPRPVAALAPAALPDPVAPRPATGASGSAPPRPAPFAVPAVDRARRDAAPSDPEPRTARSVASAQPYADAEPAAAPVADLPPGVPDWWPASGSWSVRDVDPMQVDASPAGAVGEPEPATAVAVGPGFDDLPALRQRVRPPSDPASGGPVGRRVPWPTDGEVPVLRQVRRPAAPTDPEERAAGPLVLDADHALPAHLALPDLGTPVVPATPAEQGPAAPPLPAPAAAPAPAGPSPEELADRIRHALLVERERSGVLADQW